MMCYKISVYVMNGSQQPLVELKGGVLQVLSHPTTIDSSRLSSR